MNDIVFQAAVIAFIRDWYYWVASQCYGDLAKRYRERGDNLNEYAHDLTRLYKEQVGGAWEEEVE